MKKILLSAFLLTALLGNVNVSGQDKIGLQKYDYVINGETNMFQGIPNISLPVFSLNSPTANITINLSLNYTTEGASAFNLISDVGKGWSLSSMGSIVRAKTRHEDDFFISDGNVYEAKSDVYYYTYPGGNGKFYIGMDKTTHELIGVNISPSNDKIFITKDNTKPNKVKTFSIVDTKGNKYVFDKININIFERLKNDIEFKTLINSGFFLSKIYNIKNEEVVNLEYETAIQETSIGTLQQQKIKKITVQGIGSIEYQYVNKMGPPILNNANGRDWYILDKVMLKNFKNQLINQYAFKNWGSDYLKELINLDKNNNQIQKFSFEYNTETGYPYFDHYGYPIDYHYCNLEEGLLTPFKTNRNTMSYNTLKRIILPTGGITEYEFEPHSIKDSQLNNICFGGNCYYDNYDVDKIYTVNFDTKLTNIYNVTIPSGYQNKIFAKYNYTMYPNQPGNPSIPNDIDYQINNNTGNVFLDPYNQTECPEINWFDITTQPLKIAFYGLKKGYGTLELYAPKQQRKDNNEYGFGLRIKSTKNFNPGSSIPLSYTKYEYNIFNDSQTSSGSQLGPFG
ncbi:hypothetical protein [Chryseobacterium sp. JK1]|uniref:hypothetical protein n=1 Tax=Chryseobacterium sp. JK1 TaxID=874294 RepID=UPI003D684B69